MNSETHIQSTLQKNKKLLKEKEQGVPRCREGNKKKNQDKVFSDWTIKENLCLRNFLESKRFFFKAVKMMNIIEIISSQTFLK